MKLLIIAGPYEADQIRRAAVSAGFETVAIEPGESLSGWISATRPDLIVMAPQIVNRDPNVALAKVRATPRGRVPIFFVGDAAAEALLCVPPPPDEQAPATIASASTAAPRANLRYFRMGFLPSLGVLRPRGYTNRATIAVH